MTARKFFALVIEKWPAKVISLTLAVILVMFRQMSTQVERYFTSPLGIDGAGSLVPASPIPATVRVALRGANDDIYPVVEDDVEAYLDLDRYTAPGTYRVPVEVRRKGTALNAASLGVSVEPPEVTLKLDLKESRYVKVFPETQGETAAGFRLVSAQCSPAEVLVEGPASALAGIGGVATAAIDLAGRDRDFSLTVNLARPSPFVVVHGSGAVEFRAVIRENRVTRAFELAIEPRNLAGDFTAELEPAVGEVTLEGREAAISGYELSAGYGLYVDLAGINAAGTYEIPVQAVFPGGLETATVAAIEAPGSDIVTTPAALETAAPVTVTPASVTVVVTSRDENAASAENSGAETGAVKTEVQ